MCMARIVHDDVNGTEVSFEVYADESFPDAIAGVTAAVKRLYDEVMVGP